MTELSQPGRQTTPLAQSIFWVGMGLFIGLCVAMPGYLKYGPLSHTVHKVILADNVTTTVLGTWTFFVLSVFKQDRRLWTWEERQIDFNATRGLIAGLVLHRALWVPWRMFLDWHEQGFIDKSLADYYRDSWAQLTTIPQGVWWIMFALLAAPFYRRWFGSTWPWIAAGCATFAWLIGYQFSDLLAWALNLEDGA